MDPQEVVHSSGFYLLQGEVDCPFYLKTGRLVFFVVNMMGFTFCSSANSFEYWRSWTVHWFITRLFCFNKYQTAASMEALAVTAILKEMVRILISSVGASLKNFSSPLFIFVLAFCLLSSLCLFWYMIVWNILS